MNASSMSCSLRAGALGDGFGEYRLLEGVGMAVKTDTIEAAGGDDVSQTGILS
jgi:hypothetical protein